MVKEEQYTSVPTSTDLENNSNQKKYTINRIPGGRVEISRALCVLLVIGALLLAILVGILVFVLIPKGCSDKISIDVDKEIDERLPRSIEPTHYRIQLVPDIHNLTTSGAVTIALNILEETDTIVFHVHDIAINNHSLSVKALATFASPIKITSQDYEEGYKYKVILSEKLKKDVQYQLEMKFTGKLNEHLQGLYSSHYNDTFGNTKDLVNTQLAPVYARRVFPCFDEPSFKAKFTISVARPYNMSSLSNMPLQGSDISTEKESTYWDHYAETPKIPTYLVSVVISDLKPRSVPNSSIKIWTRSEYLSHTDHAASIAPKCFEFFEKYFEIKFPSPKIDLVALPELGFTAMENWGLITFREDKLLYDPNSSLSSDKRDISLHVAHELAHQWFGNLVTLKWWDDLWLNEGFAEYFQYKGCNYVDPAEDYDLSEVRNAMAVDAFESSRPLSSQVKSTRQILQIFDEISYSKGSSLVRMMNNFLGEDTFRQGLISYLKSHQYGNADRHDLFASLTEAAHKTGALPKTETVEDIMKGWTEKPGFPVITAAADYEKGILHISQKRFYLNGKDEKSSWWIPLSFTTKKEANFNDPKPKFWIKGEHVLTSQVELDTWYILNINQTGYYIVNYDEKNWQALTEHIMTFPIPTRSQLISDAMDLAKANLLDYEIPLKMIARMAVEDKNITLASTVATFSKLRFLSDILSATEAYGNFEAYHEAVFKETYQKVNFDEKISAATKSVLFEWSCRSPVSRCAQNFMSQFRNLYAHGQSVDPEFSSTAFCIAIRDGGERNWDFVYNRYLYTKSPSEKGVLLDALGCTTLRWLLSKYIQKAVDDPTIRSHEAIRIFRAVAKNPVGTPIAFDFIRNNWNQLLDRYGDGFDILAQMVRSLVNYMNTEFQLDELERFRNSLKSNVSTATYAFDISIEIVKSNIDWMKKNYYHVDRWLTSYKDRFTAP